MVEILTFIDRVSERERERTPSDHSLDEITWRTWPRTAPAKNEYLTRIVARPSRGQRRLSRGELSSSSSSRVNVARVLCIGGGLSQPVQNRYLRLDRRVVSPSSSRARPSSLRVCICVSVYCPLPRYEFNTPVPLKLYGAEHAAYFIRSEPAMRLRFRRVADENENERQFLALYCHDRERSGQRRGYCCVMNRARSGRAPRSPERANSSSSSEPECVTPLAFVRRE